MTLMNSETTCGSSKQHMSLRNFSVVFFLTTFFALSGMAQIAVPEHAGIWVHDEPAVLKPEIRQELEALLKAERDSTSNQIAILIVQSLDGDDISAYANRVFRAWKLGQEKKDNGVLFVVALDERKVRIEVGYGLEGQLTDLLASRIIRNEVAPEFRRGNMQAGVVKGTLAIIRTISGAYDADGKSNKSSSSGSGIIRLIVIIALIILFSRFRGIGGRGGRGGYWSTGGYMGGFGGGSGSWSGGSGGGFDFGGGGSSGGGGGSGSW